VGFVFVGGGNFVGFSRGVKGGVLGCCGVREGFGGLFWWSGFCFLGGQGVGELFFGGVVGWGCVGVQVGMWEGAGGVGSGGGL